MSSEIKPSSLAALKQRLSKLTALQRAVLERELIGEKAGSSPFGRSRAGIDRAEPRRVEAEPTEWDAGRTVAIYPAGQGQMQMWFLQQYAPDSPVYNTPIAFHLLGSLNVPSLEASFRSVIQRHDSLRTTFSMEEGGLVQRVASSSTFELDQVNLEALPSDERREEADRCVQVLAQCPFDLAVEPGIRARLVRLGLGEHLLVVVLHHIVSDGWSRSNLCRELSAFYGTEVTEGQEPLPALPVQFADYTAWQDKRQKDSPSVEQTEYWKRRLAGNVRLLDLPMDRPRPGISSFRGDRCSLRLDSKLLNTLKARAQEEGATLFMVLLAAFKILLHRHTGEDVLCVGVPIANRQRVETEGLIGLFVNTLVMRTVISSDLTFRELLHRVNATAVEAYSNADIPFECIEAMLKDAAAAHRAPLLQTLFSLQDFPEITLSLPRLQSTAWPVSTRTAKLDLSLAVEPSGDGWIAILEYSTDLFAADRMERMLGQWLVVLESVAVNPAQRISEIPLLTGSERHRLLVEWNRTEKDYKREHCVHQLFEAQVARTPEAVAVMFNERTLTYRQLNQRANHLTDALRKFQVGPDTLVGLFLDRSPEMVIGLLAVLKAGGAYVPLDPANPRERLAFMLEDAQPRILLTSTNLAAALPVHAIPTIHIDEFPVPSTPEFSDNIAGEATPRNLAYMIYTSGSTGRPKGVLIEHRSLVNYTLAAIEQFRLVPGDRVLQFASLSFDVSAEEIYPCLLSGATLVLRTEEMVESAATFLERCAAWQITILDLPTAYWSHLAIQMEADGLELPPAIRLIIIGGERASPEMLALWQKLGCRVPLFNTYGPTEATIVATWCELSASACDAESGPELPIGRPVPNTAVYVLDHHLQPVPVGVTGELFIGGHGLARGYLNQRELTAERFISNPFAGAGSPRLYRTGDKVRYRSNGLLEFHGRLDQQVKVRGHRIELGEVESVLAAHPGVGVATVIARQGQTSERDLGAFVVAREANKLSIGSLREWLTAKLPDYMVPSRFALLESLPLTPNGKVDRKALEQMDGVDLPIDTSYVAPRNDLERKLVEIWKAALRQDRVGVHDNFFDLGGHSLLALGINSRITRLLSVSAPLRWIFEHPTIEALARRVESLQRHPQDTCPINRADRSKPLPMSFAQQGMWLLQHLLPDPATYNVPFAFRFSGVVDRDRIRQSLRMILERHEVLRTALVQESGILVQKIAAASDVPLPWQEASVATLPLSQRETNLKQTLVEEARRPFDLVQAPLWRALWVELGDNEHVLAFTFHHSTVDEWSLQLFISELTQLYAACAETQLSELPAQYIDYAVWQRERLTGALLEAHRSYWRAQLQNLPPTLNWPSAKTPPIQLSGRGAVHHFQLDEVVVPKLRALAREEGTTLFNVLLAVFQVWLRRSTGQTDVVVGTPVSSRERPELQSLIGFFLNTVPIRVQLNGSANFRDVLRQVRETLLGALAHAGLPFEQMVEMALKERHLQQHPIYQAMFVLLEGAPPTVRLDGIQSQRLAVDTATSKNDLTLSIRAGEGRWDCTFEYATDLFSADSAGEMARNLTSLISAIADNPEKTIGQEFMLADEGSEVSRKSQRAPRASARHTDVASPEEVYALAPLQQAMLFQHLVGSCSHSAAFTVQTVCSLHEPIDVSTLRTAWEKVVARHAILRTAYRWEGFDMPRQEVQREVILPFEFADWRALAPAVQEDQLAEYLKADRYREFEMDVAPLLRLSLFRRGDAHFDLVWTFHHILLDGRSMMLVLKEVFAFYEALSRGEQISLPPPCQYRGFVDWLQTRDFSKAKPFWQNLLAGFNSATPLGIECRSDKTDGNLERGYERTFLSQTTTSRLVEIADANDLTLNTLVQGAWALLLHRYSDEKDIVFGATRACRYGAGESVESIVGLFINTLPVRVQLNPDTFLLPWLRQLRLQWVALREYEHTPLSQVQNWGEIGRGKPLFDSILVFEKYLRGTALREQGGAWINREFRTYSQSNYPITASAFGGVELCLQLAFDRGRFDAGTITRMLGHFRTLLEGMADDPHRRLADLPLLTKAERNQILVEWNRTERDYPDTKCVHQLFEEQVERTPKAEAVEFNERSMTYLELNSQANRLARHLRSMGVGPDVPVGICLERSIEMTVAMLAILKAGGAYVPLDFALPPQRLAFMLKDSDCAVVLTKSSLRSILPEEPQGCDARPLYLVLDSPTFASLPEDESNPVPITAPHHLAYVMYTSGSTGQPKGVEMPHRALVNLLDWQCSTSGMKARTLQFASLSFDVSFQEIFSTWISGGTLVFVPEEARRDPASLLAAIASCRIERVFLPFVMLERVSEVAENQSTLPDNLREVFVAGEQLRITSSIRRFFDRTRACLWNHYGPTETHVVTAHKMVGPASTWSNPAPIGAPLANCQIYLLDEQENPVPVGKFGELYVGGVCLSRGYRQRPELTAERFIPNPFSPDPDDRLYRTGDMCRWRADGQVEYSGRLDHQVKIRGYRVELGEIEIALCETEGVREAVVVSRENAAGEKQLLAYVVADARSAQDESGLKTTLKARLPDYMIPTRIEFLPALPLTPNGKVDRRALPQPTQRASGGSGDSILPRNLLELELTRIWQQLFQREDIGRHDNFFELGGYSLLAARLAAEIENLIGAKLPIAALFQSPTIESLARRLAEENWAPRWSSLVPVQPLGSKPPLFFAHGWGGDVYVAVRLARFLAPDQPIYGLQGVGFDGKVSRHTSVEEMAAHYVEEIRSFQPQGPYYLAGYSMGGLIAFEMAQQLYGLGQRVAFVGLLDTAPRSAPWTVYGRTLAPYLWERSRFHLERWWRMPNRDRFGYLQRCLAGVQWWVARNRASPTVVTNGQASSLAPQAPGLQDYYWAVASAYQLRRYPGSIDLFLSDSAQPALFSLWGHLARCGAILHRVPGRHLEMIEPQHLPRLANSFKTALDRAQQGGRSSANGENSHVSQLCEAAN